MTGRHAYFAAPCCLPWHDPRVPKCRPHVPPFDETAPEHGPYGATSNTGVRIIVCGKITPEQRPWCHLKHGRVCCVLCAVLCAFCVGMRWSSSVPLRACSPRLAHSYVLLYNTEYTRRYVIIYYGFTYFSMRRVYVCIDCPRPQ